MVGVEGLRVCVAEAFPAVGWGDYRRDGHPVRLGLDFAFDFSGLMMLVGCLTAFYWRLRIDGTEEKKYTGTPTASLTSPCVAT